MIRKHIVLTGHAAEALPTYTLAILVQQVARVISVMRLINIRRFINEEQGILSEFADINTPPGSRLLSQGRPWVPCQLYELLGEGEEWGSNRMARPRPSRSGDARRTVLPAELR